VAGRSGLPGVLTAGRDRRVWAGVALWRLRQTGFPYGRDDLPGHATPLTVWLAAAWYMTADPGGVAALTLQRLRDLGSYQTMWTMLHRYRSAMVRPGRDLLTGRVEVDETLLGGERPGPRGRGALDKTLVVIAVELREPRGYGRARMSVIPNAETESLRPFLVTTIEPGSTVVTDGWSAYLGACKGWFVHERHPIAGSGTTRTSFSPPSTGSCRC
jgi:transposase-like protein